jgi:hypothetical protein
LNAAAQEQLLKLAVEPDDYRIKAHDGLPDELKTLLFHESTANAIDIYEPIFIPGLTQTEDYIRALFDETGLVDAADVEKYLEVRLSRRNVITRPDPAQCAIFVHENALRMPVGGPQVMHEQMLHLLFAGSRRQCPIRVVPLSAAGRGMAPGSFHIFYPAEGSPLLYLEHPTTSEFIESAKELRAHQAILNRIASVALTEAQSREFIAWMASEYEQQQGAAQDGSGPGVAQEQLQRRQWHR